VAITLKSRALALGGVVSAMALAAVLSAPVAQAATPVAPTLATTPVVNAAFVTDRRGDHRGDRCWRFWGGNWHFVCGHPSYHPRGHFRGHQEHHPVFHGPSHRGDRH
jgi:hypothetical protein